MQLPPLTGGFESAPQQSARAFRGAMRAMAMPGRIEEMTGAIGPVPLSEAAATLLLTLCDPETPLYLAGDYASQPVRDWITFHTGAPLVDAPRAMFALGTWSGLAPHEVYAIGLAEYPDRAATLIVEMPELRAQGAVLTGPGIAVDTQLSVPDVAFSHANAKLYPLGVDMFLTHGSRIAALPRTVKVR